MMSIRNKLFLEPYKGERKIEATVKSGFASPKQRSNLIGLELILPAEVIVTSEVVQTIPAGSIVYFEESILYTSPWAKQTYKIDSLEKEFIVAEYTQAVAIK